MPFDSRQGLFTAQLHGPAGTVMNRVLLPLFRGETRVGEFENKSSLAEELSGSSLQFGFEL